MKRFLWGGLGVLVVSAGLLAVQMVRQSTDVPLPPPGAETLRVASYNVHYISLRKKTGAWSVADWERRKEPLQGAVASIEADVIAFQEMESFGQGNTEDINLTRTWLLENNPEYAAGAIGPAAIFPSTQPIFYRTDRFTLLDQGWFFFSDTPEQIYSRTFNGSFPAFASWVQLEDTTTNETFRVVNVHFDFASQSNRFQSAALVAKRITPWVEANETVFVAGDYNARLGSRTHQYLQDVGLSFAPMPGASYHFNQGLNIFAAIDHVAYTGRLELVAAPYVIQKKFDNQWPTDHYPIVADFQGY